MLGRGGLDRHDDVTLDLNNTAGCLLGDAGAPRSLRLEVAAVTYDQRSVLGEAERDLIGRPAADHERNALLGQRSRDLG
jgi:hypothetical protein